MSEESYAVTKTTVQELATKAFAEHTLKCEGVGRWLCRKPGACSHWFRVVSAPRTIIIIGDLGDCVFECSDEDAVEWLLHAIGSSDYLLGKVQASKDPPKRFYPAEAIAWLAEYFTEGLSDEVAKLEPIALPLEQANAMHAHGELHEHAWHALVEEFAIDDAHSVGQRWNETMLWMVEALRTFVRLLKAQEPTP